MEKRMAYRVYKKRFDDCKTLNDYDPKTKTITVIIPDDDVRIKRNKRINTKIWKSYNNEWRVHEAEKYGLSEYAFRVRQFEDGFYIYYGVKDETNWYSGTKWFDEVKTNCKTRDEALEIVEKKWNEFKEWRYKVV